VFSTRITAGVSLGVAAVLGLAVVVTGLGTAGGAAWWGAHPSGPRPNVVIVGESLVQQVAPIETRLLRRAGYVPAVAARNSEDLGSPFVQSQVRQAVDQRTPIVVLATAANDAYLGAGTAPSSDWAPALARYRRTLASTLAVLSHQCTVLIDTRVANTSKWYELGRIGPAIDTAIGASARGGSAPVEVVRWSAMSAGHGSDWFWTDGLHFGDPDHGNAGWHPAGATAFADAIASGIEACSSDLRARPPTHH
jgi:hypothetical protein